MAKGTEPENGSGTGTGNEDKTTDPVVCVTETPAAIDHKFITIIVVLIVAWILFSIWLRPIENFAYGTMGLNSASAWHSFIVALLITTIFFAIIYLVNSYAIVPGRVEKYVITSLPTDDA